MAGLPYVPLYVVFPRGKEAIALRVTLQKPRAWSYVAEMWCGVAQFAPSGRVEGPAAVQQLEEWAGWDGAPGAFVEALCLPHVGLLDMTERGFYVHNWHLHCGLHIEKLKKDRDRKRNKRSEDRPRKLRGRKSEAARKSTDEQEHEGELEQKIPADQEGRQPELTTRPASPLVAFLLETYPDIADPWGSERAWIRAYPGIDLLAEAIRARAWEVSNPKNAKRNHGSFLNRWFSNTRPPPKRAGAPANEANPWWMRLSDEQVEKYREERRELAPSLDSAPIGVVGPERELSSLNDRWRALADGRGS